MKSKQTLKVGDRVKVISKIKYDEGNYGKIGTIIETDICGFDFGIKIDGGEFAYNQSDLKLITLKKEVNEGCFNCNMFEEDLISKKHQCYNCGRYFKIKHTKDFLAKQSTPKKKSKEIKEIKFEKIEPVQMTNWSAIDIVSEHGIIYVVDKLNQVINTINLLIKNK